ncbi:MarR family transcriptional regulator [Maribacter sp. PR1]|uniref:MarR family transcriptional regulator n=1 Tax=Maribacter cobaltidurans TaxID=1178778 RepID=A0ABU7IU81_9FLAO|nr:MULTISPECIES: MarR family transcriptional regulator [Maribacter]MDC6389053.1 MarR family transcriptional regulator [Maribacter sp. PR1]MEE1976440.1 MarR family transcriptional regulator [Maribacter cobaltidurans]
MDRTEGFGVYIDRTLKKVQSTFLQVFMDNDIDLTIEQWVILQRVHLEGKDASQADIAKSNFRNRATTSRVISGLCKKGLLRKSRFRDDQKRYKLIMTEEGKQLIERVMPLIQDLRKVSTINISENDFEIFYQVLDQLYDNFDKYEGYQSTMD